MAEATMTSAQDQALEAAALDALMNYPGVRVWTDALALKARKGFIEISGHVRTHAEKQVTEDVIIQLNDVKDVINKLYVDTDLEIQVAQALGKDARTHGSFPGILVGSAFGEIYLKGNVASPEIKKAAGEIAAQIEGVRSVNNQLVAPEPPKPAAPAAAAKPAAGAKPAAAAAKPAPKPAPKTEEGEGEAPADE